MFNFPNYSSSGRSTYPGEFTPNPFIFEKIKNMDSFSVKSAIFSNVNISEDGEYYQIELDTPGLRREDFFVSINERGNLLVSGIHKEGPGFLNEVYGNTTNNNYSGFSRELSLPANVDTDFVRAECRSGVLSIWFLKTATAYPKRPSLVVVY